MRISRIAVEGLSLSFRIALLALAGPFVVAGTGAAQCPTPDGLDGGPCCALAPDPVLAWPKMTQSSLDICWRDCGTAFIGPITAVWTPLKILPTTGPDCGYHTVRLDLFTGGGVLAWTGTMRLLYSRTWLETDPGGNRLQVRRFLVNGDLRVTSAAGTIPCPVPPCAPAFGNRVKFCGYIDYADSCTAAGGGTQIAWMLTHTCDVIDHAPGFPRAGAFHPGMSYTFVGPAAGFVVAPVVGVEGTPFSPFEAARRLLYPVPGTTGRIRCEFEERFSHSLGPMATFCMCAAGPALAPQWALGSLTGAGSCGTSVTTPGGPLLPGFLSMGIGSWTIAATYPGMEDLRWNAGQYNYTDACTGVVRPEVFYGVTTLNGYPALQVSSAPPVPLPPIFIDQANAIAVAGGAPVMNVPYLSEHVLNLNE